MATKKTAPVQSGKAAKPAAKPVKAIAAKSAQPVKKAAPAKAAPAKAKVPSKPAPRPVAKAAIKPVAKKAAPVKSAPVKPAPAKAKTPAKAVAKPVAKPAQVRAAPPQKSATPLKTAAPKPAAKPVAAATKTPTVAPTKQAMPKPEAPKKAASPAPKAPPAPSMADVKAKDIKVPAPKPVVIPKITTKTVRKYQPDFTKSVLDKSERDPGAPTQRYSDPELQEFKELIQRKLEAAKKELSYLHGLITRKDEMGGDEGDNRYMTMEDGSLSMEREQLSQMASRQITFIDHLEKALMRIENKTYGICRVTGKLIDKARLRAVPHATLSIEAKMGNAK